jgi:5,10-methylenetetrahydromethanopterin reductase
MSADGLKLGTILLWGEDLETFEDQMRLAEELGYEVIGVGDSPAAWREMIVSLTIAARETSSATLATTVTTPFMRHPATTAASMSALSELSGGRIVCVIGSGGSAVVSIGRKAAKPSEVREFAQAVRAAGAGQPGEYEGHASAPQRYAQAVPVFVSADGPRALRLAGEIADGTIVSVGHDLELVDRKLAMLREGAEAAGRDPDSLEIWGLSFVAVEETREKALGELSAFLASTGAMGLKPRHAREVIPPDLLPKVEELERRYDVSQHVVVGGSNAQLVEELGLAEFISGLNSVAGTAEEVGELAAALEAKGVSCILAALPGVPDPDGTLRRFAAAVKG